MLTLRLHVTCCALTHMNCGQLQCHVVVNKPIAMYSECLWTIYIFRENK